MSQRRGVIVAVLVGALVSAGAAFAADGAEDAAQAASESWLPLVDGGNYGAAWDRAAKVLKGAVKQADWSQMAAGARAPLGPLVSRKLKSRELTRRMPATRVIGGNVYTLGGDGQYVVLQYDTVFANKASAVETVIPTLDADGTWRVAGYSVR